MKPEHPSHLQPAPLTDTSVALAERLRTHTRGEVLFDAASRGRYATDASIYQVIPVGVFVPTVCPHWLVPAPRGNTGTLSSRAIWIALRTSASSVGTNTPTGITW